MELATDSVNLAQTGDYLLDLCQIATQSSRISTITLCSSAIFSLAHYGYLNQRNALNAPRCIAEKSNDPTTNKRTSIHQNRESIVEHSSNKLYVRCGQIRVSTMSAVRRDLSQNQQLRTTKLSYGAQGQNRSRPARVPTRGFSVL